MNRLSSKLVRRMTAVGLVAMVLLALFVPYKIADYERNRMLDYASTLSRVLHNEGESSARYAQQTAQYISNQIQLELIKGTLSQYELYNTLQKTMEANPGFEGMYSIVQVGDKTYSPSVTRANEGLKLSKLGYSEHSFYKDMISNNTASIVEPSDYRNSGLDVRQPTLVVPIQIDGQPVGIVGVFLNLGTSLDRTVIPESMESIEYAIVSERGYVISSDIADSIGKGYAAVNIHDSWFVKAKESSSHITVTETTDALVIAVPIQVSETTGLWYVFMTVPNDIIFASANNFRNVFTTALLVAFTFMIIAAYFTARSIAKPIEDIQHVMESARAGDLSVRADFHSSDEIVSIGESLNTLLTSLGHSQMELTHEIALNEELNRELEDLIQENDRVYFETIKSLNRAIEAKDPYTAGHCDRVTEYAVKIGQMMALSPEQMKNLTYGSILHDIGKLGIEESILTKPDRLTDEEFFKIKQHPEKGFEILKDIHFLKEANLIALQHHERYDGKGYPHGLAGENIHLLARIVAVTDAFDAMTSNRSYRAAMATEIAIEEIKKNRGSQFDPQIVDAFLAVMEDESTKIA